VADNTFQIGSMGLILFGGTDNLIWGNTFAAVPPAAPNPGAVGFYGHEVALFLWESGDLIFNNAFLTPNTAFTPTVNIYNGAPSSYFDLWNVPMQPATNVFMFNGWSLSGSILGLSWVGGNYWSNYGTQSDPYGVLPYNNGGAITNGGDHLPLLPFALVKVTFHETGLPSGTPWTVTFGGIAQTTTKAFMAFWDPAGTYAYTVSVGSPYVPHPSLGAVVLSTTTVHVSIHFT
jgi:hypothetical protein